MCLVPKKEKPNIIANIDNHLIVKGGKEERQVDPTIEVLMATAPTEKNTERNPINIVQEDEEKIMIYTTLIALLFPVKQEEEMMMQ